MDKKPIDNDTMDSYKDALIQVALGMAKGIGETPSEQNGFLITNHSKIKESSSV